MVVCATPECYRNMEGGFPVLGVTVDQGRFPTEITPKIHLVIQEEVDPDKEGEGPVSKEGCQGTAQ